MGTEYNLTVEQVARIAGCHRSTVLRYEQGGYLFPRRDHNGFRRFSKQDAQKLKQLLEILRPAESEC